MFKTKINQLREIGVFKKSEPLSISANLITYRSIIRFAIFTNFVNYVGSAKFVWNQVEEQFEWNNKTWSQAVYFFAKFLQTLNSAYLVIQFIHVRMYGGSDFTESTLHFIWMSVYAMLCIINSTIIFEGEDLLYFLNQLVFAINMFEGGSDSVGVS